MKPKRSSSRNPQRKKSWLPRSQSALIWSLATMSLPSTMAQSSCVSLRGSTTCPAFNQSSISTGTTLRGLFPFLQYVSDTATFDIQFRQYISTAYSQQKYQQLLGCTNVNLTNTTNLYARFTQTVLCNSMVQNSIGPCSLSVAAARPVCAETCAEYATSEATIASTPDLCGPNPSNSNMLSQIRADFTNCALPADSLSGACIKGVQNQPDNCGFNANLPSLCSYCAASSPNATDSCCVFSRSEGRCAGIKLPVTNAIGNFYPNVTTPGTTNSTRSATPAAGNKGGLSGGALAGIVVGSILGALLLLALIIGCCLLVRRRRNSQAGSMLNQPSPTRQGQTTQMSSSSSNRNVQRDLLPAGARVHHMTALEGSSSSQGDHISPNAGGEYHSSSGYDGSPESQQRMGLDVAALPKRGGSLSNEGSSPPHTDGEYSSPDGIASGHSEQMSHFKDYYSQDDIRAGEVVATLWAYQPRANDEWELERGDMLKVVGIWDDGWATGVRLSENAEQWEAKRNANRDSGVSNDSTKQMLASAAAVEPGGEIKAFPLVCVCLPQHWRKTIEGDVADPSAPNPPPHRSGSP